uniref:Uncharacterized protein n=1 Tax=Chrysemys picta bellii TaxID=8478 RepID=A0A8C3F2A6_CHRPI
QIVQFPLSNSTALPVSLLAPLHSSLQALLLHVYFLLSCPPSPFSHGRWLQSLAEAWEGAESRSPLLSPPCSFCRGGDDILRAPRLPHHSAGALPRRPVISSSNCKVDQQAAESQRGLLLHPGEWFSSPASDTQGRRESHFQTH